MSRETVGVEAMLVRHGRSTANVDGIWQGRLDYPLCGEGRDQARLAGRSLADQNPSRIYSSPLARAAESARIISREVGRPPEEIEYLDDLAERGGGMLEGYTWGRFETRHPGLARRFFELPDEERWDHLGAEGTASALCRMRRALETVRSRHESGETVVLVSHGGLLGSFFLEEFGPEVPGKDAPLANGSITRIILGEPGPRDGLPGEAAHPGSRDREIRGGYTTPQTHERRGS